MGSVKDLIILQKPENEKPGRGRFIFSDRYSVFDWGEMPDHIEDKGKAICIATAYFFEKLEEKGIKTHYLGLLENGKVKKLNELENPSDTMEIKLLRVLKPEVKGENYDYSLYEKEKVNFLIPLEVIYRNSLPPGSSVFKRLKSGKLSPIDLGLKEMPKPGQVLNNPFLDVSTKLEEIDRYISWDEAKKICNLSDKEIEELKEKTLFINDLITQETKRIGLFNEDGKIEFGFDEKRDIIIVDALGTLDECRLSFKGIPVSKEIARIFYRETEWFKEVQQAKNKDKIRWKEYVSKKPPPLPEKLRETISMIYKAYTNELTKREWFNATPLKETLEKLKSII